LHLSPYAYGFPEIFSLRSIAITATSSLLQIHPHSDCALLIFTLVVFAIGFFACHRNLDFSSSLSEPVSCSWDLYADSRSGSNQVSPELIPGLEIESGFGCLGPNNDASNDPSLSFNFKIHT
jgi:hypothetical protein